MKLQSNIHSLAPGLKGILTFSVVMVLAGVSKAQFPEAMPEHKIIMEEVGSWDAVVKTWVNAQGQADPNAEPTVAKAKEVNRAVGQFWVVSDFSGSFGGMDFKGHAITGFDPSKKKFVGTWIDSFTPSPMTMTGAYDEKTKTMTYQTTGIGMEGTEVKGKMTVVYKGKNSRVMTSYEMQAGKPIKMMEITYTRASK